MGENENETRTKRVGKSEGKMKRGKETKPMALSSPLSSFFSESVRHSRFRTKCRGHPRYEAAPPRRARRRAAPLPRRLPTVTSRPPTSPPASSSPPRASRDAVEQRRDAAPCCTPAHKHGRAARTHSARKRNKKRRRTRASFPPSPPSPVACRLQPSPRASAGMQTRRSRAGKAAHAACERTHREGIGNVVGVPDLETAKAGIAAVAARAERHCQARAGAGASAASAAGAFRVATRRCDRKPNEKCKRVREIERGELRPFDAGAQPRGARAPARAVGQRGEGGTPTVPLTHPPRTRLAPAPSLPSPAFRRPPPGRPPTTSPPRLAQSAPPPPYSLPVLSAAPLPPLSSFETRHPLSRCVSTSIKARAYRVARFFRRGNRRGDRSKAALRRPAA